MSGPPPPLGYPYIADVGRNPNINRDPPPPPIHVVPGAPRRSPVMAQGPQAGEQIHVAHAGGPNIMLGGPPMGMMGMPFGGGMGLGMYDPWAGPGLNGGMHAPPQSGAFLPGALHGIGFGMHNELGMAYPPPPPGIAVPPFAPGVPLWSGGLTNSFAGAGSMAGGYPGPGFMGMGGMGMGGMGMMGNMGMGGMGMGGMGMGGMMGMGPFGMGLNHPAPGIHHGVAPPQPEQRDVTEVPGGCPPGATNVEPPETTLIHWLKGPYHPWLMPGQNFVTETLHLDSTTGLNRVIKVCLDNQDAKGWAITECIELGNGTFEKGQTFIFDDAMSKVNNVRDVGWSKERNRAGGRSLHVYVHRI
ncbi:hypothetical protein BDV95DRAFT_589067 [Massariosphaeria phaeospora]|uniref:Uncharacterized protein n=1 Tax=Massariosphaeria phaeospora TaxID=100035 RepID=A0A7C8IF53_9PLEO|nr:hypothetical protein BDV95DRAFT_589067 [Massariosphaeria phaeospora]